jgi:O-antigen/teichoic acid export membrane protein
VAVRRSAAIDPATLDSSTLDQPRDENVTTSPGPFGLFVRVAKLRRNLDAPFIRNAYSLVGSTLGGSALGVLFWIAAAWIFSKEDVGRNTALISTMLFLSSISQLNLTNGFNRFVPTAGSGTRRLVLVGYLAATTTALVASSIFVLGVNLWAPRLSLLQDNGGYALWFVAGTVIWTVFALQDAVLTGLGEARWVFIEQVAYGVVKLVLLVSVAAALPILGIFASWTAPLAVAVLAVNFGIFRRMLPARDHPPLELVDARMVRRYVGFDMVATAMMSATIGLMPVIVLAIVGPSASAYLFLTWTIAYTLYLVSIGVGMSFVTESARAPERIVELTRKMITHSLRIVAPLAIFVAITAPLLLRILPQDYSSHATRLLQLLALSAIPNVVTATYLSIARVQRRLSAVIIATGALAAGVLVLSITLTHVIGVTGVGVAWLVVQTILALVLLLGELRTVWLPYVHVERARSWLGRRNPVARRGGARPAGREALAAVAVALEDAGLAAEGWATTDVLEDTDAIRVVAVREVGSGAEAVLKVATSEHGVLALRHELDALDLVQRAAPPELRAVVPRTLRNGTGGRAWTLETRCAGVDARAFAGGTVVADVVEHMTELYRATEMSAGIAADLPELLDLPILATASLPTSALRLTADATSLQRLQDELQSELADATVTAGRVHGNLWLGNVLWSSETNRVSGIVNWERSRTDLPAVDLMHLVCTTRALTEQRELGAVVRDVLASGDLRADEAELVGLAPGAGELSPRTVVLLMWLRHVHGYAQRAAGSRPSDVWLAHNVHQVLESV